jgi:hypothetical protein
MTRRSRIATIATLSILWCGVSASAETLRCQSINGNLNCAGSEGVSCQTVDGRKVCVSGHGDVVQSFGGTASSGDDGAAGDAADESMDGGAMDGGAMDGGAMDGGASGPVPHERLQQRDPRGRVFLLQRDGTTLHLRTDWLSLDRQ